MSAFSIILFLFVSHFAVGQSHCGRDAIAPSTNWQMESLEQELQLSQFQSEFRQGPITISVVFHQLAEFESDFLPYEYFEDQIDVLNEDFGNYTENNGGTPFELREIPVDMGIRFCLAKKNPAGEDALGVLNVLTPYPCIGNIGAVQSGGDPRIYYSDLGGSDAWDSKFYLNIWVAPTCNAFLGYAAFPEERPEAEDGVIISTEYLGKRAANSDSYPYHLGRVATHEVGHWLNLKHLWGDGGCSSDDEVADTPMQESFHRGCPIHPSVSCESPDYFFNFMDYTDDECLSMFTYGQRERVWASISLYRSELLQSTSCDSWGPDRALEIFTIYPNPSSDLLYIIVPTDWPQETPFRIFNEAGSLIREGTLNENVKAIDLINLKSGLYFIQLSQGNQSYTGSFLALP